MKIIVDIEADDTTCGTCSMEIDDDNGFVQTYCAAYGDFLYCSEESHPYSLRCDKCLESSRFTEQLSAWLGS